MNLRITSLLSNNETIGDQAIQHFFHHGHSMFRRAIQKPPRNDALKSVLRTWVIDQVLEYLLAKLLLLFTHLIRGSMRAQVHSHCGKRHTTSIQPAANRSQTKFGIRDRTIMSYLDGCGSEPRKLWTLKSGLRCGVCESTPRKRGDSFARLSLIG